MHKDGQCPPPPPVGYSMMGIRLGRGNERGVRGDLVILLAVLVDDRLRGRRRGGGGVGQRTSCNIVHRASSPSWWTYFVDHIGGWCSRGGGVRKKAGLDSFARGCG